MATADLASIGKLVARHHGWPAAKAFKAYEMADADRATVTDCALDILRMFPPIAGACALMSAAFAVRLQQMLAAPVHVVAGTLLVEGEPVFGQHTDIPLDAFVHGDLDWDGHVWVMIGSYVADISIFRTAYSTAGPARHHAMSISCSVPTRGSMSTAGDTRARSDWATTPAMS